MNGLSSDRYDRERKPNASIRGYIEWLKPVPWRFFCTFTFAWKVSDVQAEKIFEAFIDRLEKKLGRNVGVVRGDEKRFSGCGMPASARHFHALLACTMPVSAHDIEDYWMSMAGTRDDGAGALVRPYDSNLDGLGYVLKFINRPEGNWHFWNLELFFPSSSSPLSKAARRRLRRHQAREQQFAPK